MQSLAEYFRYPSDAFKSPCAYSLQAYSPYTDPWRMTMLPPWHLQHSLWNGARLASLLSLSKLCRCCLCNSTSADPAPLSLSHDLHSYGGARPWGKYRKVRNPEIRSSKSLGKICPDFLQIFVWATHTRPMVPTSSMSGKIPKNILNFSKPPKSTPSRRMIILDPAWTKKRSKRQVQPSMHAEHKTGTKLKGPAKEFVMVDHWDPKLDGETRQRSSRKPKKVRGIWKTTGWVGVSKAVQYEDNNMSKYIEEHIIVPRPFCRAGFDCEEEEAGLQKVFAEAEDEP